MTEHANEVRVGITLTVAGLLLVVGILWLGGFSFGENRYVFSIMFTEVAGLVAGDKVTVAGLDAGEILSLKLAPFGKVVAEVEVDNDIRIPIDSRISVASYGLIGAKVISVRPGGSDVYIEEGAVVQGVYEKGLGDVVHEMGEALAGIQAVLKSADEILTDQEGKDLVKEALVNANAASFDLRQATADLSVMATELRAFVSEKKDPAGEAIDAMESAVVGFAEVTGELKIISASLDSIVRRVEGGEGTLGKLVNEDQVHDEFLAAIKEVRELVAAIRDNPNSFVRFSLF
ncbi:MAG: MCE family protein [Candidatus Eisenbacteria sp.]|nr:MCE family protein [Candidatus Eisenbacteria bacterium]MCK5597389.1 MCE family protein [Candidatus Eisenbacteria bacterium]